MVLDLVSGSCRRRCRRGRCARRWTGGGWPWVVSMSVIVVLVLSVVGRVVKRKCLRYGDGCLAGGEWMGQVQADRVGRNGTVWSCWQLCRELMGSSELLRGVEGRVGWRAKSIGAEMRILVAMLLAGRLRRSQRRGKSWLKMRLQSWRRLDGLMLNVEELVWQWRKCLQWDLRR